MSNTMPPGRSVALKLPGEGDQWQHHDVRGSRAHGDEEHVAPMS
jgi:hypothetical protein